MPRVGFEPTSTVFDGTKTVHDLDRVATVIGCTLPLRNYYYYYYCHVLGVNKDGVRIGEWTY
jgi:hypothetical protein